MDNFLRIISEKDIIRYADIMIINSSVSGILNKDCLDVFGINIESKLSEPLEKLRNELLALAPTDHSNLELTKKFAQNIYDNIYTHLIENDYIKPLDDTKKWKLSDTGKFVKRVKGHDKYLSYLQKKIDSEIAEMNGKIDWLRRVIITAVIAFILGIISVVVTGQLKCKKENTEELKKK